MNVAFCIFTFFTGAVVGYLVRSLLEMARKEDEELEYVRQKLKELDNMEGGEEDA